VADVSRRQLGAIPQSRPQRYGHSRPSLLHTAAVATPRRALRAISRCSTCRYGQSPGRQQRYPPSESGRCESAAARGNSPEPAKAVRALPAVTLESGRRESAAARGNSPEPAKAVRASPAVTLMHRGRGQATACASGSLSLQHLPGRAFSTGSSGSRGLGDSQACSQGILSGQQPLARALSAGGGGGASTKTGWVDHPGRPPWPGADRGTAQRWTERGATTEGPGGRPPGLLGHNPPPSTGRVPRSAGAGGVGASHHPAAPAKGRRQELGRPALSEERCCRAWSPKLSSCVPCSAMPP